MDRDPEYVVPRCANGRQCVSPEPSRMAGSHEVWVEDLATPLVWTCRESATTRGPERSRREASSGSTLVTWDIPSRKRRILGVSDAHPEQRTVLQVALEDSGTLLATAHQDGSVRVWNLGSGGKQEPRRLLEHADPVLGVAFRPDGSSLLTLTARGRVARFRPSPGGNPRSQPPARRLPSNPFSRAKVGDWLFLSGEVRLGEGASSGSMGYFIRPEVESEDKGRFVLKTSEYPYFNLGGSQQRQTPGFSSGEVPTLEKFMGSLGGAGAISPEDVTSVEERRALGTDQVPTTRVRIGPHRSPDPTKVRQGSYTFWFSPDLKAPGLVAASWQRRVDWFMGVRDATFTLEAKAQGTGDRVEWETRKDQGEWPYRPFESAAPGDWSAIASNQGAPGNSITWEVTALEPGAVLVRVSTRSSGDAGPPGGTVYKLYPRSVTPSLGSLTSLVPLGVLENVKVAEDRRSLGDREVPVKRLEFSTRGLMSERNVLWISPEIQGPGVLAFRRVILSPDDPQKELGTIEMSLVGHGTKDQVLWGRRPEKAGTLSQSGRMN